MLNVNAPKGRQYFKRISIPWLGAGGNGVPAGMMSDPLAWRPVDVGGKVVYYNPSDGARGALELLVAGLADPNAEPESGGQPAATPAWLPVAQSGGVILRPGDAVYFPSPPGKCFVRPAPGEVVTSGASVPGAWANVSGITTSISQSRAGEPVFERAELLVADDVRFLPGNGRDVSRLVLPALQGTLNADLRTLASFFSSVTAGNLVYLMPLGSLVPTGTLRKFTRHLLHLAVIPQTSQRSSTDQRVGTLSIVDNLTNSPEVHAFGCTEANSVSLSVWDVTLGGWGANTGAIAGSYYQASAASASRLLGWYVLDKAPAYAGAGFGPRPIYGRSSIPPAGITIAGASERVTCCVPVTRSSETVAYYVVNNLAAATAVLGLLGVAPGIDGGTNLGSGYATAGAAVAYLTRGMDIQPASQLTVFTVSNTGAALVEGVGSSGCLLANTTAGQTIGRMEFEARAAP